jgi:hypothetical protein
MNQIPRNQQPTNPRGDLPIGLPRQASAAECCPPERPVNYVAPPPPPSGYHIPAAGQAPGIPMGSPPQAWAGPSPDAQSLAAPKGIVARLSVQAGLLFGGFVIAAIALFFPWVTVSVDSPLGGDLYKADASPFTGGWIFAVLVVIAGAAWLAWPILSGSQMSVKRLSGLTAVVCLQIGCLVIGFIDYANGAVEKSKATTDTGEQLTGLHVSVGLGLLLYTAAVVAIVVGVVRVWIHRSRTEKRAP